MVGTIARVQTENGVREVLLLEARMQESHNTVYEYAVNLARKKPNANVLVLRILDDLIVQEVKTAKLVRQ